MEAGWSDERQAFVQYEGSTVLDAAVLMLPLVKFISLTDPKWLSTLDELNKTLVSDSLVYRYDPEAGPDGLRGQEGTFTVCSFWHVEALTRAAGTMKHGSPSRRCSPTPTMSDCSPSRSARPESNRETFRRR